MKRFGKGFFESFGNARLLLENKLGELDKIGGLWKIRGDEKIANALAWVINAMKDLNSLATVHTMRDSCMREVVWRK